MRLAFVTAALAVCLCVGPSSLYGQVGSNPPPGLWRNVPRAQGAAGGDGRWSHVKSYRLMGLDQAGLHRLLKTVPSEKAMRVKHSPAVITLPMPAGSLQRLRSTNRLRRSMWPCSRR